MNENSFSSRGEMPLIQFHSVNVEGIWAHLAEKNSRAGAKITTIFRLS